MRGRSTLALAAFVLFLGSFLQRRVPLLARSNIPGPVIGGLLFAGVPGGGKRVV